MNESQWAGYGSRAAARRAVARRFHPDLGGDPADLVAALAAVDTVFAHSSRAASSDRPVTVLVRRRRPMTIWMYRLGTQIRHAAGRPRRYIDI